MNIKLIQISFNIPLATEISILHLRFLINPVGEEEKDIIESYTVEVFIMVTQRTAILLALFWMFPEP